MGMSPKIDSGLDNDPWDKVPESKVKKWNRRYNLFVACFYILIGAMDIVAGRWWAPIWFVGSIYFFYRYCKLGGHIGLRNWFKKKES